MQKTIDITEFIPLREHLPILDVRSPSEFASGHIPGAVNLPLFDDKERADVGTLYKQSGRDAAVLRGLDHAGKKLSFYVGQAVKMAPKKQVLMHCWRGGMRSGAMAWLLSLAGFTVQVLEGGYQSYRRHIAGYWKTPARLLVVSGKTGSGKTPILHHLRQEGEQVLDLEYHARHKGSAFGALGQGPQPSTEQFENELADTWARLDLSRPVWTEDESRSIGKVFIPEALHQNMQKSLTACLDVPEEARIRHLVNEYAGYPKDQLIEGIRRITRRLGGLRSREAIEAIEEGNFYSAIRIVLHYYDKAYTYDLTRKDPDLLVHLPVPTADAAENADALKAWSQTLSTSP